MGEEGEKKRKDNQMTNLGGSVLEEANRNLQCE